MRSLVFLSQCMNYIFKVTVICRWSYYLPRMNILRLLQIWPPLVMHAHSTVRKIAYSKTPSFSPYIMRIVFGWITGLFSWVFMVEYCSSVFSAFHRTRTQLVNTNATSTTSSTFVTSSASCWSVHVVVSLWTNLQKEATWQIQFDK